MADSSNLHKEIKDNHWLASAFFIKDNQLQQATKGASRRTNLNLAFHDTSLGGNASMNPKYQFTRLADPKAGAMSSSSGGQGLYYNEAIDENAQRIWLQAGVMDFNSISAFLKSSYNYKQAYLANHGEVHSTMYTIGQTLGFLSTLPLQVYFGINYIYRRAKAFIQQRPYSRYAYMTPTMSLYWTSASIIFNKIAANMNITPGLEAQDVKGYSATSASLNGEQTTAANLQAFQDSMPDTFQFDKSGLRIDLMAVSSKGQRLANQYYEELASIKNSATSSADYQQQMAGYMTSRLSARKAQRFTDIDSYINAYSSSYGKVSDTSEVAAMDGVETVKGEIEAEPRIAIRDKAPDFFDFLSSELRDGSAFVSFVVENQGPLSDSFSNTTKAPGIEETINGVTKTARDAYYNFAGGNFGDGFISDAIEGVVSSVGALLQGGLDSIGLGGLAGMGGSALMEFSEVYDDSEAQKDGGSFTIRLSTPYGNKVAILQDIYAPLSMLMALALPKATGKSSYTSPFIVRLYSPGRADFKLAMVKNMTITRGTSNIGWSKIAHLPTAIDVTFEVEDLSNVMIMPLTTSMLGDALSFSFFDEDSPLQDYLSSLSGMSLYEQYYISNRIATGARQAMYSFNAATSPAAMAQAVGFSSGLGVVKMFTQSGIIDQGN